MIWLCAFLLCLSGWGALAMAMKRHRREVEMEPVSPPVLRVLGASLLGSALIWLVCNLQISIAITAWIGLLGFAIWGPILLLTYRPKILLSLSVLSGGLGIICAIFTGLFA